MSPRKPSAQTLIPPPSPGAPAMPYTTEDSTFSLYVQDQRTQAQRTIDDLSAEVSAYEAAIARRTADTASNNTRDDAEIRARRQRIEDLEITVMRCDAALAIDVTPGKGGNQ